MTGEVENPLRDQLVNGEVARHCLEGGVGVEEFIAGEIWRSGGCVGDRDLGERVEEVPEGGAVEGGVAGGEPDEDGIREDGGLNCDEGEGVAFVGESGAECEEAVGEFDGDVDVVGESDPNGTYGSVRAAASASDPT